VAVLILSPFFFPEPISTGKYNTVLARSLAASGEEVIVIASHPLYPEWRPKHSNAELPGVDIKRGGAWMRYPRSASLRRAALELWYALFCLFEYLRLPHKPRHIVAVFPPSAFMLALTLVIARGSVVTGIVHDLQSVHVANSNSILYRLIRKIVAWIEKRSFSACSQLVFLSQSMAERAMQLYGLDGKRCAVCHPFQTIACREPKTSALAELLRPEHINVVYSGALGEKQCPDELLAFMARLASRNDRVRCHVFSAGPHFGRLKRQYSPDKNSRISFRELVAEENLEELYSRSTVQLIPQAGGTSDGSLPSKLANLMWAGVPIFAICDSQSEVGGFLMDAGAGLSVPSFADPHTMASFDALLAEIEIEPRAARIARVRPFVERRFDIGRVVDLILRRQRQ
jgi:colanic acid biosynthesis glycosyl transferase WcaI